MTRLGFLAIGLVFLAVCAGVRAEQSAGWTVVCDYDGTTAASHCYLSLLTGNIGNGSWLGIAVQRLNGSHEIQVTSNGETYDRAEINVQSDTIIVTDYCYDSYCVFVRADELVEQFRTSDGVDISFFNGRGTTAVRERVSLRGFAEALETYLGRIGE